MPVSSDTHFAFVDVLYVSPPSLTPSLTRWLARPLAASQAANEGRWPRLVSITILLKDSALLFHIPLSERMKI